MKDSNSPLVVGKNNTESTIEIDDPECHVSLREDAMD